jgi:excisionase family DNA binding protein
MSIDAAITEAAAVALAPVLAELRAVRAELAEIRAVLPPRFVSLKEAAELMGVDPRTIVSMGERGECRTRRAGRRVLVDAASLRPPSREQVAELARTARRPRA